MEMRPMLHADLVHVMAIEQAVHDWPWSLGNYEDCLSSRYDAWVLVAPDGELQGYYVQMMVVDEAHLLTIAVKQCCQRQGLGKYLLVHALDQAKRNKLTSVLLELRLSNRRAMQLYQSCGFVLVGRRKNYYRVDQHQREDALIMRMDIASVGDIQCG